VFLLRRRFFLASLLALTAAGPILAAPAGAEEPFEVKITIRNHRFEPAEIEVPAGRPLRLIVTNADSTPEEFESVGLGVERIIPGGATATFMTRPLRANRNYTFFGEFNQKTAQGKVTVK
jgi:Cupredoxin-like domain